MMHHKHLKPTEREYGMLKKKALQNSINTKVDRVLVTKAKKCVVKSEQKLFHVDKVAKVLREGFSQSCMQTLPRGL